MLLNLAYLALVTLCGISKCTAQTGDYLPLNVNILGAVLNEWNANPSNYTIGFIDAMYGSLSVKYPQWTKDVITDIVASAPYVSEMDTVMVTFAITAPGAASMSLSVLNTINNSTAIAAFDSSLRTYALQNGTNVPGFSNAHAQPTVTRPPADFITLNMKILGLISNEWNVNPVNYTIGFTDALWGSLSAANPTWTKDVIVGVQGVAAPPGNMDTVLVVFSISASGVGSMTTTVLNTINNSTTIAAFDSSLRTYALQNGTNVPGFSNAHAQPTTTPPAPSAAPTYAPTAGPTGGSDTSTTGGISESEKTRNIVIAVLIACAVIGLAIFMYCKNSNEDTSRAGVKARRLAACRMRDAAALTDPQVINPITCTGEWSGDHDANKRRTGRGVMKYSNGQVYDGEMLDGCRCGSGKCTYPDGKMYFGEWDVDMWHGQGLLKNTVDGAVTKSGQWEYGVFRSSTKSDGFGNMFICKGCTHSLFGSKKHDELSTHLNPEDHL